MLLARLRTFFSALRRRSRMEAEMDAELAFHREEFEAELVRSGISPKDARRRARIAFGAVDAVKEDCRQALGLRLIDEFQQDIRYALRSLANHPGVTAVAVLSLALGIGANTAMFSLIDQLLLRTLPVRSPNELVCLYSDGPWSGTMSSDESGGPSFSYPAFREMAQEQTPFVGLAGARNSFVSLAYGNRAEHGTARLVSGDYFDLLGVRAALGRLLSVDDDRTPGAHPVAVLGHAYWTSRFGGDPAILNQTILVNSYPLTIVGVAQEGFRSEVPTDPPAVYVPISMAREVTTSWDDLSDRQDAWVTLFGRLKPGVTLERAEVEINIPYRSQLEKVIPLIEQPRDDFLERFRARTITLRGGQYGRGGLRDNASRPLLLLTLITMLVLLIACANVANLQLARGAARMREVSIRLATGASRGRLIRQFLVESWCVALTGGAVGIAVAFLSLRGILAILPTRDFPQDAISASLDARVLLFCAGLSLVTGIVFGLFPAIRASKTDLASSLKDQAGQVTLTGSANRLRKALVAGQVAVSLLLLIPAGLLMRTLGNLTQVDLGIQVDRLVVFSILPGLNGYTDEQTGQLHDRLSERLEAIPGVRLVSSATVPAIAGSTSTTSIELEGYVAPDGERLSSRYNTVGPGYFRTMGIPLMGGREFTPTDGASAPPVAIVNEALVREYLDGQNAIGRHITRGRRQLEIVGVVRDAHYAEVREEPPPLFYTALRQSQSWYAIYFYVRTAMQPAGAMPLIRREVASIDSTLPIRGMTTMQEGIEQTLFGERILAALTTVFAALALTLAAIGLYGVLAYNIARRTREIGIRVALGADSGQVRGLVIREVAFLLVAGTAVGLAAAAAATRVVQAILYGLERWDAVTYALAVGLLWLVSFAAAYIPARRAARIEPSEALRYE